MNFYLPCSIHMLYYTATYTKEYATKTADMSLHFRGKSEHCNLTLTQGLQLQKRFWKPQKPSKLTPETNIPSTLFHKSSGMSHFSGLTMNFLIFFNNYSTLPSCPWAWSFKLLCNSSYLAIKQLHQNLDLANMKPKDLAGKPIAKGFLCIIYRYTYYE